MEYDVKELKEKIDDYFSGILLKGQLGGWAEQAYYDLLKGGYIEKKKIVIYPFLKIVSQIHIESNDKEDKYPCSEEDIKDIQNILHGEIDYEFQVEMSIPLQIYNTCINKKYFDINKREVYLKIREIIFALNTGDSKSHLLEQVKMISDLQILDNIVQEILEETIIKIIRAMFDVNTPDVVQKNHMCLYARKQDQKLIIKKLLEYIDCYIGDRNFNALVSYKAGIPELMLLV